MQQVKTSDTFGDSYAAPHSAKDAPEGQDTSQALEPLYEATRALYEALTIIERSMIVESLEHMADHWRRLSNRERENGNLGGADRCFGRWLQYEALASNFIKGKQ